MTRIETAQLNILHILFYSIISVIVASLFLYGFFISTTVGNIVERKSFERRSVEALLHIGKLESKYMELRSNVTPSLANSLGFSETENVIFAVRGLGAAGLAKLDE